ncbi:MAG TPA: alpha-keto acid decarboxylase family protein [Aliidongia sp.]|nr:alpha-keto acid decarboxylase family protein [Aliidongia sp.]
MSEPLTVAQHLVNRLAEIGIRHLFGVPGDFNLLFLDAVIAHPQVRWVGNVNELNAAYAADGYARCHGAAALLTTFGVGELSAVNGLAGSYAEHLPVLQIVGVPSTPSQRARKLLHHTLGDGEFERFSRMHREVTVAQAHLTASNAVAAIDHVLSEMLLHRRPGYIVLPTDVVSAPVPKAPPFRPVEPLCDDRQLAAFTEHARKLLAASGRTAVLADLFADRFGARAEVRALIEQGGFDHAAMLMSKGLLDETAPGFAGTYIGALGSAHAREMVETADVLIAAGLLLGDLASGGFSHRFRTERLIDLQPFHASVAGKEYRDVPLRQALRVLTEIAPPQPRRAEILPRKPAAEIAETAPLTQAILWDRMERFLRPDDLVVADMGTAYFGMATKTLPKGAKLIGQPLWGSIGYSIPAAFGAGTAAPDRRLIVLVGDGSAQLTAQEISAMLRDGQKPIIFLVNNDGYTIERAIHGAEAVYNDIPRWDWQLLARAMGGEGKSVSLRAETVGELDRAMETSEAADTLTLVELVLPKHDVPELLATLTRAVAQVKSDGD